MNSGSVAGTMERRAVDPRRSSWALAASLLLVILAGGFGSLFTPDEWYAGLTKPPLNPPGWVFGPVWTTLYLLMAVAAWLVWRSGPNARVTTALTFYGMQLILNSLWSPIFFGFRHPGLALLDLFALWFALAGTILAFCSTVADRACESLAGAWFGPAAFRFGSQPLVGQPADL